ncbi:MAG: hypothetical protein AAGI69_17720 [Cyanobacteria bacterium P01_H01_bin.21]
MLPTLGQAIWLTGFAQSFANNSIFSIYATNFGYPEPAAIAFGLSGAYPISLLIRLGIHPADAYAFIYALWLTISFLGAWKIARNHFKLCAKYSSLMSVVWLSLPIVWGHAGYSALAIGIGLLPFYFWTALQLFNRETKHDTRVNSTKTYVRILLYLFSTIVAVFMDGYSFMMFAVASSFLGGYQLIVSTRQRKRFLLGRFVIHCACFTFAYVLYALYIGKTQFEPAPLDFFRGWGVDLSFLVWPTQGMHWLWDFLGLSSRRIEAEHFGDGSVWITTYSLPLIILGFLSWFRTRKSSRLAFVFLLISVFGFYMALGPSLKINSIRPEEITTSLMPESYALFPTGNGWISENLPGFQNMRAAYRWMALSNLGFWLLATSFLAYEKSFSRRRNQYLADCLCAFLIVSSIPNLQSHLSTQYRYRNEFLSIERTLISDIQQQFKENELVAFLPYTNDFFVNYIASRTDIDSYNIGGDKNLATARENWPEIMKGFDFGHINNEFSDRLIALLANGEADAVVLPNIDLLWAAHKWPTPNQDYDKIQLIAQYLSNYSSLNIETSDYYTIVRLEPSSLLSNSHISQQKLESWGVCLEPTCVEYDRSEPTFNISTQVGTQSAEGIKTTGHSGYLIFGPYAELEPGTYTLDVEASVDEASSNNVLIDVASTQTQKVFANFEYVMDSKDSQSSSVKKIELSEKVIIDELISDLEVRIFVSESTNFTLNNYTLRKD